MSAKVRQSGEQISKELEEIRTTVAHLNGILLALVPQDHSVMVGSTATTRPQLKDTIKNVDKALRIVSSKVRRGVRRRLPADATAEAAADAAPKRHGGLDRPNYYADELIRMFLNADLGTVDPMNAKSEKITDVLKRSVFGKKNIATSHTFSRLFSILIHVNNFKDPQHGQYVKFPEGWFQKNLPSIYDVLVQSNFDFTKITYIHLGKITSAGIVNKAVLNQVQLTDLSANQDAARDLEGLIKQTLDRFKLREKASVPAVPASIGDAEPRRSSPKKK